MVKFETVEEIGIVEHEDGMKATVSVLKRGACEGCTLKTCNITEHAMTIEALNPIRAQVGQKVKISMKSNAYIISTMIVYGIPALALLLGAVVGREIIGPHIGAQDLDTITALSGIAACTASVFSVGIWSRTANREDAPTPVIEEILEHSALNNLRVPSQNNIMRTEGE